MAGRVLLDTTIIIDLLAGDEQVRSHLGEVEEVFVPSIAVGELLYGARVSARTEENRTRVKSFVSATTILACDEYTPEHYAVIKARLRAKGRPIPENDIWIAAVARQHKLILVARDTHFDEIEDLEVRPWR